MTLIKQFKTAAIIGCCGFAIGANAMTTDEIKAQKKIIDSHYDLAKTQCDKLKDNAEDICMAQAKGTRDVAKAELDARQSNTAASRYNFRMASADANYDIAKEKCDDFAGNPKDVCLKDAKATYVSAKTDAKSDKKISTTTAEDSNKVAEVRKDADSDKRDANYDAAKERCDVFSGDAKDKCIDSAKKQMGVK